VNGFFPRADTSTGVLRRLSITRRRSGPAYVPSEGHDPGSTAGDSDGRRPGDMSYDAHVGVHGAILRICCERVSRQDLVDNRVGLQLFPWLASWRSFAVGSRRGQWQDQLGATRLVRCVHTLALSMRDDIALARVQSVGCSYSVREKGMAKKALLLCVIALGALVWSGRASAQASGDDTAGPRSEERMTLALGINRPNLVWASDGDLTAQRLVLDTIRSAGARRVRLALQLPYENALEHILHCNQLGMDVVIWIGAADPAFYAHGAVKREGVPNPDTQFPSLWDQYRLADLDITRFRAVLGGFLRECRDRDARIEALQIMNEPNWADFNGDLPVVEGGWFVDDNTAWDDERFVVVRAGIRKCGEAIKTARTLADEIYGPGQVKILTPGMADPPDSWVREVNGSIARSALYLELLRGRHARQHDEEDYVRFADGIGVHFYPGITDTAPDTGKDTALQVIRELMDPILERVGTDVPFWVTEWGYPRHMFGLPPDESKRLTQFRYFLDALKSYRPGRITWGDVMLFDFDMMPQYDIYADGRLLESGEILRWAQY
jgi:hypothetical protein